MTYSYGLAPPEGWIGNLQYVDENTEFQVGEIGGFVIHRRYSNPRPTMPYSEAEIAKKIRDEMKLQGNATVTYMEVTVERFYTYPQNLSFWDYKIKCVFKGSPMHWAIIVGILILVGLGIIVVAPLIWKYGGLDPEDVKEYLDALSGAWGAIWLPIIVFAIIAVIGMFFLFGGSISKKGMSAKGR